MRRKVLGEKVLRTTLRKATTKIVGRKSLINSAYVLANFVRNQGQTAELMSARLGFACFSARLHAAWQATASPLLPETVTSKKKTQKILHVLKGSVVNLQTDEHLVKQDIFDGRGLTGALTFKQEVSPIGKELSRRHKARVHVFSDSPDMSGFRCQEQRIRSLEEQKLRRQRVLFQGHF